MEFVSCMLNLRLFACDHVTYVFCSLYLSFSSHFCWPQGWAVGNGERGYRSSVFQRPVKSQVWSQTTRQTHKHSLNCWTMFQRLQLCPLRGIYKVVPMNRWCSGISPLNFCKTIVLWACCGLIVQINQLASTKKVSWPQTRCVSPSVHKC